MKNSSLCYTSRRSAYHCSSFLRRRWAPNSNESVDGFTLSEVGSAQKKEEVFVAPIRSNHSNLRLADYAWTVADRDVLY